MQAVAQQWQWHRHPSHISIDWKHRTQTRLVVRTDICYFDGYLHHIRDILQRRLRLMGSKLWLRFAFYFTVFSASILFRFINTHRKLNAVQVQHCREFRLCFCKQSQNGNDSGPKLSAAPDKSTILNVIWKLEINLFETSIRSFHIHNAKQSLPDAASYTMTLYTHSAVCIWTESQCSKAAANIKCDTSIRIVFVSPSFVQTVEFASDAVF